MRIQGGLKPEDWQHWGQFTTFKSNAPELLRRELRANQRLYCSPLVDSYQPAEETEQAMPAVLRALIDCPPRVFVLQTRGPLILRDVDLLQSLSKRTILRVSFSVTTNREEVRRLYEPHCGSIAERLDVIRKLRDCGIETYATLAPLLPCDPEVLASLAVRASGRDLIGDPLHVRATKQSGATTRAASIKITGAQGHSEWLDPEFQSNVVDRIAEVTRELGRSFEIGARGFGRLATV